MLLLDPYAKIIEKKGGKVFVEYHGNLILTPLLVPADAFQYIITDAGSIIPAESDDHTKWMSRVIKLHLLVQKGPCIATDWQSGCNEQSDTGVSGSSTGVSHCSNWMWRGWDVSAAMHTA